MKAEYERPPLYAKQLAFVDCPARYTVVEASTKTGKTVACLVWLLEQSLKGRGGWNYWWIAPTYSIAGIAFTRLKRWLADSGLPRDYWTAKEAEQAIELGNGTKVWFKGADKPDSLYGEDVYGAVVDEASRCKADAWYAVRSTLTATAGPVKIIGNVRGRKNWAYEIARKAQSGARDMAHFKLTAWDAVDGGVLDRAEVEDAQRNLPPDVFKELYLAEPSDDGGNPFGITAIRRCVGKLSKDAPVAFGVDLAKSQDFTVVCGLDATGAVCVLERWQSDWGQTRSRILSLVNGWPTLIDSTGVGDPIVEELQRTRSNCRGYKFTSQSKQQLMEGLAVAIHRNEVMYPDGWLVNELEAFEYEYTRTGVRYSAPAGLHDDGVCALALAVSMTNHRVEGWDRETVAKVFSRGPTKREQPIDVLRRKLLERR
jgi:hypothetical protein